MNEDIIVLHGIGQQGWLTNLGADKVAAELGVKTEEVALLDYSADLDKSPWHLKAMKTLSFILGEHGLIKELGQVEDLNDDVLGYFADTATRKRIVQSASDVIRTVTHMGGRAPITIVAHSLGTVVAWEALRHLDETDKNWNGKQDVNLILLGSPLVFNTVRLRSGWGCPKVESLTVLAGGADPVAQWGKRWGSGVFILMSGKGHDVFEYWNRVRQLFNK